MSTPVVVTALRAAVRAVGDPDKARDQQRYMKSDLPYRGVTLPDLRKLVRATLAQPGIAPRERREWERGIRLLWDEARFRDERYAATILARHRCALAWQDPDTMPLYRHLIVTGAWWDHVDEISAHLVGPILLRHKETETGRMRAWATEEDLWLRRCSIICQLQAKQATDTGLLAYAIERNVEGTAYGSEFFIRKAIGWALRQHARIDPAWVGRFVAEHSDVLSPLSKREAMKHLPPQDD